MANYSTRRLAVLGLDLAYYDLGVALGSSLSARHNNFHLRSASFHPGTTFFSRCLWLELPAPKIDGRSQYHRALDLPLYPWILSAQAFDVAIPPLCQDPAWLYTQLASFFIMPPCFLSLAQRGNNYIKDDSTRYIQVAGDLAWPALSFNPSSWRKWFSNLINHLIANPDGLLSLECTGHVYSLVHAAILSGITCSIDQRHVNHNHVILHRKFLLLYCLRWLSSIAQLRLMSVVQLGHRSCPRQSRNYLAGLSAGDISRWLLLVVCDYAETNQQWYAACLPIVLDSCQPPTSHFNLTNIKVDAS